MEQPSTDCCIDELMQLLQTITSHENLYALALKNVGEIEDEDIRPGALEGGPPSVAKTTLLEGGNRRRYNLPSHMEVAIEFVEDDGPPPTTRDVVIYPRGQPLRTISISANLDPRYI